MATNAETANTATTESYLTEGDRAEVIRLVMACRASTRKATVAKHFASDPSEADGFVKHDEFTLRSLIAYLDSMAVAA